MKYQEHFLEKHSARRSGEKLEKARSIVVHYTATAGASPKGIAKYWARTSRRGASSAHVLVGDMSAVQVIPYNEVAHHVGSRYVAPQNKRHKYTPYGMKLIEESGRSTPNYCTIGIEMCQERQEEGSIEISEATRENTIEIVRDLMKAYEIGIENVVTHYEVVGWKSCPAIAIEGGSYGTLSASAQQGITMSAWWREFKARLS